MSDFMLDNVSDNNIKDFNTLILNSLTIIPLLRHAPAENKNMPTITERALQLNSIKSDNYEATVFLFSGGVGVRQSH